MNEPTYEKFKNALFINLCKNLQINEKDLNSLPKADPEIVDKYKFYLAHEKAKEDFFKEKFRQVLEDIFNKELKNYLQTKNNNKIRHEISDSGIYFKLEEIK